VHGSLGVLLLTGAYNFWRVLTNNTLAHSSVYQDVLGVKMVLFLIILGLAIVALKRAAGSAATPRARRLLPWMVFLTLLVVLLSTYLNLERIHLLVQDAETSAVTAPAGTG
ncbi:MAG TPA: hypothetical protein VFJ58_00955, partial [Armatimonadota bacterium]|nr:hypothetical protein [Armatimonadota bacterium]